MPAFYNEHNPQVAQWLRELIKAGHIAPGVVDGRSIEDITPSDLAGYTQHHFFAGIGVWSYALRQAGWSDDRPVWTGSCPCQPFSQAGKGKGFDDDRHLWPAWHWLIKEYKPGIIFGEQVANGSSGHWFDIVSTDLEGENYAIGAIDIPACGVGAPHLRQRRWFVAERVANTNRRQRIGESDPTGGDNIDGKKTGRQKSNSVAEHDSSNGYWENAEWRYCTDGQYGPVEPGTPPMVDGAPNRVVRVSGYGNAINAEVAKQVIKAYM